MSPISVRRATISDAIALILCMRVFGLIKESKIAKDVETSLRKRVVKIACDSSDIVCFVVCWRNNGISGVEPAHLYIGRLFVRADWQKRVIGKLLLDTVKSTAYASDLPMATHPASEATKDMFSRRGYIHCAYRQTGGSHRETWLFSSWSSMLHTRQAESRRTSPSGSRR